MRTVVVDASVIGSSLLPDEEAHAVSSAFLELARRREYPLLFPMVCLTEIGSIVGRRLRRPDLIDPLLRDLLLPRNFRLVPFDEAAALNSARMAARTGLRAADAIYASTAIQAGALLVSLDRQQMERASSHVDTVSPDALLSRWNPGDGR